MTNPDEITTRQSLEKLLALRDEQKLSEELMRHGPILDKEVPVLTERARGHNAGVRRNATRLLRGSGSPGAKTALRQLVLETEDPVVWALALGALLEEPDAQALAAARPKLIEAAMPDTNPTVQAVALRAAVMAGIPGIREELARRLADADTKVREAAVVAIDELGDHILEAKLRERILIETDSAVYSALVLALSNSDDPTTADTLRQVIANADRYRENDFSNSVAESKSRKPWFRAFLLDLAKRPGKLRWSLFGRLAELKEGALDKELMEICIEELDKFLPAERSKKWLFHIELTTCLGFISTKTGQPYKWDELFEAREAARKWLGKNSPQLSPQ